MEIKKILEEIVRRNASDVYLTVNFPPAYRVDGKIIPGEGSILEATDTEKLASEIMTAKQKAIFVAEKEMNLALGFKSLGRFRVNLLYQRGSVSVVIRQIKLDIQTVEELGLPEILKSIIMDKRGLVLVVGGTGSGKSTSLAAMINHRNVESQGHIITVEDPIEFIHRHKKSIITQREVGIDTLSFADALKNTLRQAPDVILIGEIRDTNTMEAAITFSETGHLCLGTLHANNANQAIERIINFFPSERHDQIYLLLSLNLNAIISQRLIPTTEGGRIAAMEVLLTSPRIKDLLLKGEVEMLKEAMSQGNQEGMFTFDQSIFNLFKAEKISYENALVYADSTNDVRLRIKTENLEPGNQQARPTFKIRE
ncbi:MAG: PilT/PilU family type 4a pilus ATPase [Planctomycetes bacterium]|nr:PilT/PilU family type 4a pilus ATPase [Planctomycetota bacterium]